MMTTKKSNKMRRDFFIWLIEMLIRNSVFAVACLVCYLVGLSAWHTVIAVFLFSINNNLALMALNQSKSRLSASSSYNLYT